MNDHLIITLDPDSEATLQAQIRQSVVEAILARAILPGDKLASSRALARQLGVSRNTVILAYDALVDTGFVTPEQRSGYVVSDDAPVTRLAPGGAGPGDGGNRRVGNTAFAGDAKLAAAGTAQSAGGRGDGAVDWRRKLAVRPSALRQIVKPLNWREFPFPFVYGQVDDELFPLSSWRDCARQAHGVRNFGRMVGDFGQEDDPMLVNYICSRSLPRRGITARPEQILVTLGAQNALYLIAQLLVGPKSRVVIENPSYPDLHNILGQRTKHITPLRVDGKGLVIDERVLGESDAVFITPSHQCPTTHTMPASRRRELLDLAHRRDFVIVEDDYEFEMNFLEAPTPALKSQDRDGRVIYVGSLSKSVFPGLRLGYMVAPAPVIEEARALRHLMLRHPPGHAQRTLAYFMALGHYDAQIRHLRRHLAVRRKVLQEALAECGLFTQSASHFGGTSFWVRGPKGLDSGRLAELAAKRGVLVEPGDAFFASERPPAGYFRLAYSSISQSAIPEGVARLAAAVGELGGARA